MTDAGDRDKRKINLVHGRWQWTAEIERGTLNKRTSVDEVSAVLSLPFCDYFERHRSWPAMGGRVGVENYTLPLTVPHPTDVITQTDNLPSVHKDTE